MCALKISARKEILRELLKLEEKPGRKLISPEELELIKRIWEKDRDIFGS